MQPQKERENILRKPCMTKMKYITNIRLANRHEKKEKFVNYR